MRLILISCDSKTLLERKIKEIVGKSTNVLTYPMNECEMESILEEASYVSMFEEEKFLIIKNADFFGKEKEKEKDSKLLLEYLEHPYPYTTLIFTTYGTCDQRKKITKKIQEVGEYYEIHAPKNMELQEEIKKMLRDYNYENSIIRYIEDSTLGNFDIIVNELSKFELCFQKGDKITLEQIKKIIAPNINENVFKFVDAVIQKDIKTVFSLLNDFEVIKLDAIQLVNVLGREYRLMFYYKIYEKKRKSKAETMKEMKLQDWQLEKVRKESMNYTAEEIKDNLVQISKLDTAMKNGTYEKNLALRAFLLQVLE